MSTCPEKDLHSIYLDGELPKEFLKEYETHVAGCEKCRAELENLKVLSAAFREEALSIKLDQNYLDQSFARLQTKMRYKENSIRCEKPYAVRPYVRWVSGFAAAAAVFALVFTPLSLRTGSKGQEELTAIARTDIKPIQENKLVVDGNLENFKISAALGSDKKAEVAEEDAKALQEKSVSPSFNQNQKVVSATSLASNFRDIDVFRPDFKKSTASVSIEFPYNYTIPLEQADKIENR